MSALKVSLPPQIHLLTLEEYDQNNILIRLEHIYEKHEVDSEVTVNIQVGSISVNEQTVAGIKFLYSCISNSCLSFRLT